MLSREFSQYLYKKANPKQNNFSYKYQVRKMFVKTVDLKFSYIRYLSRNKLTVILINRQQEKKSQIICFWIICIQKKGGIC